MSARILLAACVAAALAGCGTKDAAVPNVEDHPAIGAAALKDIPERIPAYGIVEGERIVVSIEASDSPRVHEGQPAWVYALPSTAAVACRVTRTFRGVSAETNQALAWLEPISGRMLPANSFVSAAIEVARHRRAITIPRAAVMIQGGRTVVLRVQQSADHKTSYEPAPVTMGVEDGNDVEVLSGLKPGEEIVTSGGIGLLFPDFKAASD